MALNGIRAIALLGITPLILISGVAKAEEATLQDIAKAMLALPHIVIYQARKIVTLDPEKPTAEAIAVVGDRILATGCLDELKAAAGKQPHTVNTTFADQVAERGAERFLLAFPLLLHRRR